MIKDENYFVVHGWMLNRLGLKGTDLQVYAIIYGFSQTEKQNYTGSAIYLSEWTGSTVRTIRNSISSLCGKGLLKIIKKDATHSEYHAIVPDFNMVKNFHHNGEKISPSNSEKISPSMMKKFHHNSEKISPNNINNLNKDLYKIDSMPAWLADKKPNIPSLEEVKAYATAMDLKFNPVKFYEYYQEKKWIKKNGEPVKSWKLTMCRWSDNEIDPKEKAAEANSKNSFQQNEYDFEALEEELRAN